MRPHFARLRRHRKDHLGGRRGPHVAGSAPALCAFGPHGPGGQGLGQACRPARVDHPPAHLPPHAHPRRRHGLRADDQQANGHPVCGGRGVHDRGIVGAASRRLSIPQPARRPRRVCVFGPRLPVDVDRGRRPVASCGGFAESRPAGGCVEGGLWADAGRGHLGRRRPPRTRQRHPQQRPRPPHAHGHGGTQGSGAAASLRAWHGTSAWAARIWKSCLSTCTPSTGRTTLW